MYSFRYFIRCSNRCVFYVLYNYDFAQHIIISISTVHRDGWYIHTIIRLSKHQINNKFGWKFGCCAIPGITNKQCGHISSVCSQESKHRSMTDNRKDLLHLLHLHAINTNIPHSCPVRNISIRGFHRWYCDCSKLPADLHWVFIPTDQRGNSCRKIRSRVKQIIKQFLMRNDKHPAEQKLTSPATIACRDKLHSLRSNYNGEVHQGKRAQTNLNGWYAYTSRWFVKTAHRGKRSLRAPHSERTPCD